MQMGILDRQILFSKELVDRFENDIVYFKITIEQAK
jgi:hypothetical protein